MSRLRKSLENLDEAITDLARAIDSHKIESHLRSEDLANLASSLDETIANLEQSLPNIQSRVA